MAKRSKRRVTVCIVDGRTVLLSAVLLAAAPVHAYVGPGAGLSAIGSALALLGAILLMIVGFVWYPVKRFLRRKEPDSPSTDINTEKAELDDSPQQQQLNHTQSDKS